MEGKLKFQSFLVFGFSSVVALLLSSCFGGVSRVQPAQFNPGLYPSFAASSTAAPIYGSASDSFEDQTHNRTRHLREKPSKRKNLSRSPSSLREQPRETRVQRTSRVTPGRSIGEHSEPCVPTESKPYFDLSQEVDRIADASKPTELPQSGYPGIRIRSVSQRNHGRYIDIDSFKGTGWLSRNANGVVELNTVKHVTDGSPPYKVPTHIEYEINGVWQRVALSKTKVIPDGPGESVRIPLYDTASIPEYLILKKAKASDSSRAIAYGFPDHNGRQPIVVDAQIPTHGSISHGNTAPNSLLPGGRSYMGTQVRVPISATQAQMMGEGASGGPVLNERGEVIGSISTEGSSTPSDKFSRPIGPTRHYYSFSPVM